MQGQLENDGGEHTEEGDIQPIMLAIEHQVIVGEGTFILKVDIGPLVIAMWVFALPILVVQDEACDIKLAMWLLSPHASL